MVGFLAFCPDLAYKLCKTRFWSRPRKLFTGHQNTHTCRQRGFKQPTSGPDEHDLLCQEFCGPSRDAFVLLFLMTSPFLWFGLYDLIWLMWSMNPPTFHAEQSRELLGKQDSCTMTAPENGDFGDCPQAGQSWIGQLVEWIYKCYMHVFWSKLQEFFCTWGTPQIKHFLVVLLRGLPSKTDWYLWRADILKCKLQMCFFWLGITMRHGDLLDFCYIT